MSIIHVVQAQTVCTTFPQTASLPSPNCRPVTVSPRGTQPNEAFQQYTYPSTWLAVSMLMFSKLREETKYTDGVTDVLWLSCLRTPARFTVGLEFV